MFKKIAFYSAAVILLTFMLSCATAPLPETGIKDGVLHRYTTTDGKTYGFDYNLPVRYNRYSSEKVSVSEEYTPVKRQLRAVWVATVWNLNFPPTSSQAEYKLEYNKVLKTLEDYKMNAVIFQIRPLLDAFYPSEHSPWSQYVTSAARQGTDPGWDPLAFMVEETHKRGMEFHAWFNPFRVFTPYNNDTVPGKSAAELDALSNEELLHSLKDAGKLAANNFAVLNPQYVFRFDRRLYLDAGIPAARQGVAAVVREVIEKYDVDVIHFDDYFYPYGASDDKMIPLEMTNRRQYPNYPGDAPAAKAAREQWRRDNITALIKEIKAVIDTENKKNKRAILFGISPFGVWNLKNNDPRGAEVGPMIYTYSNDLYADTYQWVKDELIDHIIPQLYWSIDDPTAPYAELLRWWSSVVQGTRVELYTGHANYKHVANGEREPAWINPQEVPNQLRLNQLYTQVKGSVFFSYRDMIPAAEKTRWHKAQDESIRVIKSMFHPFHTLVSPKPWLMPDAPASPLNVTVKKNVISWNDTEENNTRYYVVYRAPAGTDPQRIINDPLNIAARVWRSGQSMSFTDNVKKPEQYTYAVTALNAAHIESEPQAAR